MKPSSYRRLPALALLLGSLALIGCGGAMTLPDSVVSTQATGHAISGIVYGGHSPIVGMHVYLAQPGTGGYGSQATSILTTGTANVSLADGGDPYVPVGAMYATSDPVTGNFTFGPYTCASGQPVFVYGYGGSPLATTPSNYTIGTPTTTTTTTPTPETVSITGISVAGSANNGTQDTANYTITVGSALPLTNNQTVSILGLTGNLSILNGNRNATVATTGTNTTFTITATAVYGDYTYSYYTKRTGSETKGYTYSDQVTGTYYETVGNGTYTATGQNDHNGNNPSGDDGGGDDNGPAGTSYEFTITGGTTASTGTAAFSTGGTATATEPVTTTTTSTTYANTTSPIVQLASLGNCDSAAFHALSFIYMNEVSTIAAAYTFQPFTLPTNNNAWDIGSSGSTLALTGIENAASTAAQLYAVQGSTEISTTDQGEGHLANYQTQSGGAGGTPNEGNGVVPQATIDTLANILASCIDSAVGTSNSLLTSCTTLFNTATDGGGTAASDTAATDTATAAINIARYPAGNNSLAAADVDTGYVSTLYDLQGSPVPYAPDLSGAPNDWTIAINYPSTAIDGSAGHPGPSNSSLDRAESVEIDNAGQVWITAQGTDAAAASVVRWSPLGVLSSTDSAGYIYGYVSIDGSSNAWAGNAQCPAVNSGCTSGSGIEEFADNGVLTNTYGSGYDAAYTVLTDNSGDAFFVASTANTDVTQTHGCGGFFDPCTTTDYYQLFEYGPGGSGPTQYTLSPAVIPAGDNVAHGAIDGSSYLWLTTESSYQIARVLPNINGTVSSAFTPIVTARQPEFPSIDNEGNAWIAIQAEPAAIYEVPETGGPTILTSAGANFNGNTTTATGATLNATFGSAVDGNGNVWFANRCDLYSAYTDCTQAAAPSGINSLVEIHGEPITGVPADQNPGTALNAISPTSNYIPETEYPADTTKFTPMLNDSLNLAIDPSGNIWVTNYLGNAVVEIVGAAAPVVTPLSVAAGTQMLGVKP